MQLHIAVHPTGELRTVSITSADYDALLALGYPDATHWRIGNATGRVNITCPFTGEHFPVVLLLKRLGDGEMIELADGDPLNLFRENLRLVSGTTNGTVRNAKRSWRLAFAALSLSDIAPSIAAYYSATPRPVLLWLLRHDGIATVPPGIGASHRDHGH
ncbi:hypothetical protein [Bosea sp. AS-1]|jgi:hypothetical protein|uniref:hypothetical protein n=1 Tax=Bosea sp. AS-1 TaxID=2015316 RepID=UPI000B787B9E|nr:hypothetical protein [Bosea sp. AS-1]